MKEIPENTKIVLKAVGPLIVIIFLIFLAGKIGYDRVIKLYAKIQTTKKDNVTLSQKLDLLKEISTQGKDNSILVATGLPDSNPSIVVVSQVRNLAAENGLLISAIKSDAEPASGETFSGANVKFSVQGKKDSVYKFIQNLELIAPITVLNSVKIRGVEDDFNGDVSIKTFWSQYPTSLPSSPDGFIGLTEEDNVTLMYVKSLKAPVVVEMPEPSSDVKSDPFN